MLEAHSHGEENHDNEEEEGHGHSDDDHHAHDHEEGGSPDPHIWLSPRLVKTQARTIYNALTDMDPAGEEIYREGYESLIRDLDELDAELTASLTPYEGSILFVFHPAFGYFADDYGLTQVAVEMGGKEPSPPVLEEIIEHARKEGVRIIFVQPEFSRASARAIAEAIDGSVVTLNPLNPDYIANLRAISDEVEKAVR
jgi:zinc transport system substrate-binding protein